jgi:hypothetical protein
MTKHSSVFLRDFGIVILKRNPLHVSGCASKTFGFGSVCFGCHSQFSVKSIAHRIHFYLGHGRTLEAPLLLQVLPVQGIGDWVSWLRLKLKRIQL